MTAETPPARVSVRGIELHATSFGRGEPVVLVHGSLADSSYWQKARQVAPLSERYQVITYSRRYNHPNRNEVANDHSALVEAEDLAAPGRALPMAPNGVDLRAESSASSAESGPG